MTRERLLREIEYFRRRVRETAGAVTPQQKRAHTLARNCLRERRRKLTCFDAIGHLGRWTDFHVPEEH